MTHRTRDKKPTSKRAILSGGLFSDSAKESDSGKLSLEGIFTSFLAWGFPCARTWFLTFTVFGLPKTKHTILFSIKKHGSTEHKSLSLLDTKEQQNSQGATCSIQLSSSFESAGRYEVLCSIQGTSSSLRIPVDVCEQPWVEFSNEEKKFVSQSPQTPKSLRANVQCQQCSYTYIFEESLVPERPKGGVKRFPTNGQFDCKACGHTMNLRDIQGRLRASLKEMVHAAMRRD